ncbi:23S rRNA (guanosine(2251)-2'-O)-methyltransferase RlmB [Ornithinimicrobium pratense]|uniref:23S rRNA (Guanosine(2251)-2'-O)-methyltransferase RlmB n=1 Tax=Ornithinimicrobium pratense TaxID=2593973 RepID=A0A5J6V6W4_9MICO|nr:23S rRNA (guanosine(2251)-2'-O)-methyltransferase RlmB [Ornithinimicrobium pratense]QFG69525.1 23S rRNA (guanosine(2251)-2'-O)-methyltransferase RlmB [Ornithinimicrobium pratense]
MAGNQQRRAARTSNKKGMTVGSGGQRRKQLKGRGPTPKAEERVGHPAARRAARTTKDGGGRQPARRSGPGRGAATEVVVGRNSVLEALRTGVPGTALHVGTRMESDDRVKEAITLATEAGIALLETPRGELDRITDGAVHQGLALTVPPYDYAHPDDLLSQQLPGVPLIVALDGITDPRNLGAIIRSAGAFGGHGVVVPARRSAGVTAAAWKTSAGAAARIRVAQATNLTRTLEDYRKAGFFVIGLDADGDVELPGLALADQPLVVVIGSEGKGLSRLVRETCDQIVSIPMAGVTESLNAGIAAAVTLYEIARARARR